MTKQASEFEERASKAAATGGSGTASVCGPLLWRVFVHFFTRMHTCLCMRVCEHVHGTALSAATRQHIRH